MGVEICTNSQSIPRKIPKNVCGKLWGKVPCFVLIVCLYFFSWGLLKTKTEEKEKINYVLNY